MERSFRGDVILNQLFAMLWKGVRPELGNRPFPSEGTKFLEYGSISRWCRQIWLRGILGEENGAWTAESGWMIVPPAGARDHVQACGQVPRGPG